MRYEVTEIEGFLAVDAKRSSKAAPGLSVHVIDRLTNHRVMATWRTEDYGGTRVRRREIVRARAAGYAARLNGEQAVVETISGFRPTCPREACAVRCEPDALYCPECNARLYTLDSGRYGVLDAGAALLEDGSP